MKIYHNPRCTKSRETLALIHNANIEPEIVEYLKTPPDEAELRELLRMLGIPAEKLIRKGESIFKELYKGKKLNEDEWIQAMLAHPKLIERPVVVKDGKAIIGRPPENVLELLG
jgi:arsenate reductase